MGRLGHSRCSAAVWAWILPSRPPACPQGLLPADHRPSRQFDLAPPGVDTSYGQRTQPVVWSPNCRRSSSGLSTVMPCRRFGEPTGLPGRITSTRMSALGHRPTVLPNRPTSTARRPATVTPSPAPDHRRTMSKPCTERPPDSAAGPSRWVGSSAHVSAPRPPRSLVVAR
jgi:hypothetical protein